MTIARDGSLYCWHFQEDGHLPKKVQDEAIVQREQSEEESSEEDDKKETEIPADRGLTIVCAEVRLSSKHRLKQGEPYHRPGFLDFNQILFPTVLRLLLALPVHFDAGVIFLVLFDNHTVVTYICR